MVRAVSAYCCKRTARCGAACLTRFKWNGRSAFDYCFACEMIHPKPSPAPRRSLASPTAQPRQELLLLRSDTIHVRSVAMGAL